MAPVRLLRTNGQPLTASERRLVLRAMALIAIPLAAFTLFVMLIGGALVSLELRDRARESEQVAREAKAAAFASARLAIRLDDEQQARTQALTQLAYDNCVENENQDAANDLLFAKVQALISQGPPTRARNELLAVLRETRAAREPPNEPGCKIPAGANP
jgi:hypothetical protein